MSLAFSGIRILDFTQVLAGPFATQQLAQLGAEVIKVEHPDGGDQTRGLLTEDGDSGMSPAFMSCNLGKRSLTLNLKAPEAAAIIARLVARADVVVENFKPGVMDRLGLGYDALAAINEQLIYCSISGYGQDGPKAPLAAYDGAIQAASGMMSITGHASSGPVRTGYMPVDMATALNAAFAISGALYRRLATGAGQRLDVAMMDTAMVLQAPQVSNYLVHGVTPPLMGNASPTKQPTANVFPTADGYIQVIAIKEPQVEALLTATGLLDRYSEPEFASLPARLDNSRLVGDALREVFATRTTSEWLTRCEAVGLPVAEIRDYAAVSADPQFAHRLAFAECPHPQDASRSTRVVSIGFTATTDQPSVSRPAPQLGEHTDAVLAEIGFDAAAIAALRRAQAV